MIFWRSFLLLWCVKPWVGSLDVIFIENIGLFMMEYLPIGVCLLALFWEGRCLHQFQGMYSLMVVTLLSIPASIFIQFTIFTYVQWWTCVALLLVMPVIDIDFSAFQKPIHRPVGMTPFQQDVPIHKLFSSLKPNLATLKSASVLISYLPLSVLLDATPMWLILLEQNAMERHNVKWSARTQRLLLVKHAK